jgi:hypothetical protein
VLRALGWGLGVPTATEAAQPLSERLIEARNHPYSSGGLPPESDNKGDDEGDGHETEDGEQRAHGQQRNAIESAPTSCWRRLKTEAQACIRHCRLWKDRDFPHASSSLFRHKPHGAATREHSAAVNLDSATPVRWLSLRELYGPAHRWPNGQASYLYAYERPQHTRSQDTVDMNAMAEHAMNPSDVVQGNVGNCYFLSAVATAVSDVAVRRQLIDATFEAAGIYGVSFFLRGRWRMVWVDSYFPCHHVGGLAGSGGGRHVTDCGGGGGGTWQPVFARSSGVHHEAWLMVVEKAFAKLHGCYEALAGGQVASALAYLTGGVAETELLHTHDQQQSSSCRLAAEEEWSRLCSVIADGFAGAGTPPEGDNFDGLVPGHAYALLATCEAEGERLVLLRNPWGKSERRGEFHQACASRLPARATADDTDATDAADAADAKLHGKAQARSSGVALSAAKEAHSDSGARDGTFWMSFEAFRCRFAMLYHCRVLRTLREGGAWHRTLLSNEWYGTTAGGCPNHRRSWASNPQFGLFLRRACRVVLVLDQLQLAEGGSVSRGVDHAIGMVVLQCGGGRAAAPLKKSQVVGTSKYVRTRQVSRNPVCTAACLAALMERLGRIGECAHVP